MIAGCGDDLREGGDEKGKRDAQAKLTLRGTCSDAGKRTKFSVRCAFLNMGQESRFEPPPPKPPPPHQRGERSVKGPGLSGTQLEFGWSKKSARVARGTKSNNREKTGFNSCDSIPSESWRALQGRKRGESKKGLKWGKQKRRDEKRGEPFPPIQNWRQH